ncbi:MAG: 3-phosphoshikimate 1-carboxyvinyltransferase [Methanomassiliicoccus sp.]|nr:3-phosphoshikimate 1-carboxyvinyltransferase [Methanomassiliicoccus sp.]
MKLLVRGSAANGKVQAPPSKSYTHRAIVLASLAHGDSRLRDPLLSGDTLATLKGMEQFGAIARTEGRDLVIRGGKLKTPSAPIDCANSGTTLRLLSGIASLLRNDITLTGDESLRQRPMKPLLAALNEMGVKAASVKNDGLPPLTIRGPNHGRWAHIKGDISSQFISSLLISSALKELDTEIVITTPLMSKPYVEITRDMMARHEVISTETKNGYRVLGSQRYRPRSYAIPGDYSSASFPLVAGALTGRVAVTGLDPQDRQGDRGVLDVLRRFGAPVSVDGDTVTAEKGELRAASIDVGDMPDAFPILAVLATQAAGVSQLTNARHLRFKESDRIATTTSFLKLMGADIEERDDGCVVRGPTRLKGRNIDPSGDHRILMAAAVAGLVAEGTTTISDGDCYRISYPGFVKDMGALGCSMEGSS